MEVNSNSDSGPLQVKRIFMEGVSYVANHFAQQVFESMKLLSEHYEKQGVGSVEIAIRLSTIGDLIDFMPSDESLVAETDKVFDQLAKTLESNPLAS